MRVMKKRSKKVKEHVFVCLYGSGEGQLNNCNCNMVLNC
jgi:hypothetical protein